MDPDDGALRVVALVSSAGGLAATTEVLGGLPADLPAAVLVLQHVSPDHVSGLAAILDQRTALRVTTATGGERLEAGTVLVAPPGSHTLVTPQRRLLLVPSGPYPPHRPSADLLLTTLALAVGSCAIAVVLTGGGNDGATGATVMHVAGGVVLATDEASSADFSMPSAAIGRATVVDAVVPVQGLAAHLVELVAAPRVARPPGPHDARFAGGPTG